MNTNVKRIADVVRILTKCTSVEAIAAEKEICQTPTALATFAAACGISASAISIGGTISGVGAGVSSTVVAAPVGIMAFIGGAAVAVSGYVGAVTYCSSMIAAAGHKVKDASTKI